MEDTSKFSIKGIIQKLKEYLENYTDLAYLKFVRRGSKILPSIILTSISVLFILFVVFYLSMALAFFIGEWLGSYALGFALTGVAFIVLLGLLALAREPIKKILTNICIKVLVSLRKDDDDE